MVCGEKSCAACVVGPDVVGGFVVTANAATNINKFFANC